MRIVGTLICALAALAASGRQPMDYEYFLTRLTDLDSLYKPSPGVRCAQASSYDRASKYDEVTGEYVNWGANGDHGFYERIDPDTGEAVMADLKGPGCVFRIWSANPQGKVRLYLDGATKPSYEFDFRELFMGTIAPFKRPLVWARGEGGAASDCFLPIPYRERLVVTADKAHDQYYHIGYMTYPAGTDVESFRLPLTDREREALEAVRKAWLTCGPGPLGVPALEIRHAATAQSEREPQRAFVLRRQAGRYVAAETGGAHRVLEDGTWALREAMLDQWPLVVGGDMLRSASVRMESGRPRIDLTFDEEGTARLARFSGSAADKGEMLVIILDGGLWDAQVVKTPIRDGALTLDPVGMTQAEAEEIVKRWNTAIETGAERRSIVVPPGGTITVLDLRGPAVIRGLWARQVSGPPARDRAALVRIQWDGEETPSVEAPLHELFGTSFEAADYQSYPLGMVGGIGYCRFPMPFRKSAKVSLVNQGREPVEVEVRARVSSEPVPDDALYFRAKWRRERFSETFDYPFLECSRTAGKFVGAALFIDNIVGGWWGEGDEKVYVDGEKFPSTFGTGSEDYFGDAWGIRYFENPTHGCPLPNPVKRWQVCYRWHLADRIPFETSFRITIENYSANGRTRNDYASVAYWYQAAGGRDFFKPTAAADRKPLPPVIVAGAREAESLSIVAPAVSIELVEDDALSMGAGVRVPAGAQARIPVTVETAGPYVIEVFRAPGDRVPASMVRFEGEPLGDKVRLVAGVNYVTVEAKDPLVLDTVQVTPWRNFVRNWKVLGPFPNEGGAGLDKAYIDEARLDLSARPNDVTGKPAQWRDAVADANGVLDFAAIFTPANSVACYAAFVVVSPDDREARLLLGSDDGVKVWVNGEEVWVSRRQRGVVFDEDKVPVKLRQGRNTVLVKVEQGGGAWGLALRVEDPDERLTYELPK